MLTIAVICNIDTDQYEESATTLTLPAGFGTADPTHNECLERLILSL